VPEVIALAGALAYAGEHGVAPVALGDVVDQFHDQHGLAHAGATEEARLAALRVGLEQVDDLDARLEHLGGGVQVLVLGGFTVDGQGHLVADGTALVHGITHHVDDAAQGLGTHGHIDGLAGVGHDLAPHHALGGLHGHAAHAVLAEVLLHFQRHQRAADVGMQRIHDRGKVAVELDVHGGTDDGDHAALKVV